MNWQSLIKHLEGVAASDAIIVAKILSYFPLSEADPQSDILLDGQLDEQSSVLFTVLLCLHLHQQQGNTRLPLDKIAGKTVFKGQADEGLDGDLNAGLAYTAGHKADHALTNTKDEAVVATLAIKSGFTLPALDSLVELLQTWLNGFDEKPPYILQDNQLYIQRYYHYELGIYEQINARNITNELSINETARAVFNSMFPPSTNASADIDWQAVAVANALQRQFMVLNGGPGTGKTYTVARLLIMLQCIAPNMQVQLVAPTGKAAQRLSESLQDAVSALSKIAKLAPYASQIETQAQTIHKALGVRPGSTQTSRSDKSPLKCGLLVIDEFSMVDSALFAKVLNACRPNTRILLVGDSAQLPSVEAGNVLGDLSKGLNNGKSQQAVDFIYALSGYRLALNATQASDHVVTLARNHRSNKEVNELANSIESQNLKQIKAILGDAYILKDELQEHEYLSKQQAMLMPFLDDYVRNLSTAKNPSMLLNALKAFRVLSPIRKGPSGIEQLNQWINQYLLKHAKLKMQQGVFHGQAIMITVNDPSTGLSNGDVGLIWREPVPNETADVNSQKQALIAYIERDNGSPLKLSTNRLPHFETAFALTIHKTQGSEYDKVLIVLPYQTTQGCTRELLYTGVTRAKEEVKILARENILRDSLSRSNKRDTYLGRLLERFT